MVNHSVATIARSCSQSSCIACGYTQPAMAIGHIANSKWLRQNEYVGTWMVSTGFMWPWPISHHACA